VPGLDNGAIDKTALFARLRATADAVVRADDDDNNEVSLSDLVHLLGKVSDRLDSLERKDDDDDEEEDKTTMVHAQSSPARVQDFQSKGGVVRASKVIRGWR